MHHDLEAAAASGGRSPRRWRRCRRSRARAASSREGHGDAALDEHAPAPTPRSDRARPRHRRPGARRTSRSPATSSSRRACMTTPRTLASMPGPEVGARRARRARPRPARRTRCRAAMGSSSPRRSGWAGSRWCAPRPARARRPTRRPRRAGSSRPGAAGSPRARRDRAGGAHERRTVESEAVEVIERSAARCARASRRSSGSDRAAGMPRRKRSSSDRRARRRGPPNSSAIDAPRGPCGAPAQRHRERIGDRAQRMQRLRIGRVVGDQQHRLRGSAARRASASIRPAPKLASKAATLSAGRSAPVAMPQYPAGALCTELWKRVGEIRRSLAASISQIACSSRRRRSRRRTRPPGRARSGRRRPQLEPAASAMRTALPARRRSVAGNASGEG